MLSFFVASFFPAFLLVFGLHSFGGLDTFFLLPTYATYLLTYLPTLNDFGPSYACAWSVYVCCFKMFRWGIRVVFAAFISLSLAASCATGSQQCVGMLAGRLNHPLACLVGLLSSMLLGPRRRNKLVANRQQASKPLWFWCRSCSLPPSRPRSRSLTIVAAHLARSWQHLDLAILWSPSHSSFSVLLFKWWCA
ncbi:hypothetical protein IWZ01DRAFT_512872 [Phyllosticta capitalensis]